MTSHLSHNLGLGTNHVLLFLPKLLFELLLSQLNERILEGVFGHDRAVELEALVLALHLLKTVDFPLQFLHLLLNLTLVRFVFLLKELVDLSYVVLLGCLQNLQSIVFFLFILRLIRAIFPIAHIIDLLINLNLSLRLEGVKKLLFLSVLFQLLNVPSKAAAHVVAEPETDDADFVDQDAIDNAIENSHF